MRLMKDSAVVTDRFNRKAGVVSGDHGPRRSTRAWRLNNRDQHRAQNVDDVVRFADCTAVHATAKALLVDVPDLGELWVPQSVIDDESEVFEAGHEGELILKEWWANKEGLV